MAFRQSVDLCYFPPRSHNVPSKRSKLDLFNRRKLTENTLDDVDLESMFRFITNPEEDPIIFDIRDQRFNELKLKEEIHLMGPSIEGQLATIGNMLPHLKLTSLQPMIDSLSSFWSDPENFVSTKPDPLSPESGAMSSLREQLFSVNPIPEITNLWDSIDEDFFRDPFNL